MSVHFEQELEELKQKLLGMAGHAEAAVTRAIQALGERNAKLAAQVDADDDILDRFEIEVDELAIHLLAKAPLASHLRFITVAMKASHDLERVGDEGTNIARRVRELTEEPPLSPPVDIPHMADLALSMLHDALQSFVNHDPAQARAVIPRDQEVDALNRQYNRALVHCVLEDPHTITRCMHLMAIVKSLERVADHATNIAEEVVYLCEALDIRHQPEIKHGVK